MVKRCPCACNKEVWEGQSKTLQCIKIGVLRKQLLFKKWSCIGDWGVKQTAEAQRSLLNSIKHRFNAMQGHPTTDAKNTRDRLWDAISTSRDAPASSSGVQSSSECSSRPSARASVRPSGPLTRPCVDVSPRPPRLTAKRKRGLRPDGRNPRFRRSLVPECKSG